ncbi:DEAD/DEAH box helicase [Mangrovibacillus cuniculi]|uniref:DEAD/DEAH box helicase n=1 Tax=Mangrovibacillus cuniculi TaxID=2593652 RepID=A0A7S8HEU1_9BACI|nr:DEAD/DEAH box helicase [Mangrovibacillus cuniculi]QPC45725.1 DEAD/DEAH box helicase [Mangrovibacillus cuniculi]
MTLWEKTGFETKTSIQEQAMPLLEEGKDVIGQSPTGTGKTLAFLLPALERIDVKKQNAQVLILASSQELIMQTYQEALKYTKEKGITAGSFIGGANIKRQVEKLKKSPQLILGTPGRVLELIKLKKLKMHAIKLIILDEADQVLAREHRKTVDTIISSTLKSERQLAAFSATMPNDIIDVAKNWMNDPTVIKVEQETLFADAKVDYFYLECEQREKSTLLEKMARFEGMRGLAFSNDITELNVLEQKLRFKKVNVRALHGEKDKLDREQAIQQFRANNVPILLATDVASRGLDIPDVGTVIHIDFPLDEDQATHRSGRTGRAGKDGQVVFLLTPREVRECKQLAASKGWNLVQKVIRASEFVDPK